VFPEDSLDSGRQFLATEIPMDCQLGDNLLGDYVDDPVGWVWSVHGCRVATEIAETVLTDEG
jgi:hypothetical protein